MANVALYLCKNEKLQEHLFILSGKQQFLSSLPVNFLLLLQWAGQLITPSGREAEEPCVAFQLLILGMVAWEKGIRSD